MDLCVSCMPEPTGTEYELSRRRKSFAGALCASIVNAVEMSDYCLGFSDHCQGFVEDCPRQTCGPIAIYRYAFVCACERCQEEQAAGADPDHPCLQTNQPTEGNREEYGRQQGSLKKELQCALDNATILLFEQEQAEQCFMQSHAHVSNLPRDEPLGYISVQLLILMASAARICALLSAPSPDTAFSPWWSRALCCRLVICCAVETAVILRGETGLLPHATCNRQELCALAEAVLALVASSGSAITPAGSPAAAPAAPAATAAPAQAQAQEAAQASSTVWPLAQDEQLWSWATQASGLCWNAWHRQEHRGQQLEQDLASLLMEVCSVFHEQAQKLAESPWLLVNKR
ncbi:hypothetical protein DUNSADRAFT_476 [Dunaliella salina]|uniref:Uncharacterized protein n=1 Tax=Dunaliella salina TaxID=3046 RepID=A0ABQ7FYW8_DUNSA|nr:hypothetical protein DUNSADRAFT_476 [Dunaliella salina]|eukprot:KAF5827544.1 hypothetical protein DUNSADRAFT_476 [Dunaliella salina]